MDITRGDAFVFMTSIRIITAELKKLDGVKVPDRVYAELSAMETVLERDYLGKSSHKPCIA